MLDTLSPLEAAEIIERGDCGQCRYDAENTAIRLLRAIAAGEYTPVVHGEWLNFCNDFSTAECSECGEAYEVSSDENPSEDCFNAFKQFYKHCPSCGARMDGKDDSHVKKRSAHDTLH